MATGKKMSEYTPFSELSSEEKATYLGNAAVTTFGVKDNVEGNINVNIPLSTLVPSATDLAGDGLSVNGSTGKLDVSNKVPAPTATTDRGKVLSVATDSDNIVWSTPAVPEISQYNGNVSAINATNDSSSGGYVFDVNLDTDTLEKRHTTGENQVSYIAIKNPVPSTTGTNEGDVLTVDANGDIGWAAPSGGGGGGGGNPYTKATVTPGDCYLNGKTSSYDMPLYDQDVTISNNTYSVLPSSIGYYPVVEEPEYRNAHNLDNLVIRLPSNTEFPMAVVEFTVQDNEDYSQWGCVNNVKVKVGETELTRMYSAPYNPNTLLMVGEYNNQFQYWTLVTEPNHGNPYYRIEGVFNENRGADISAFAHGTKVQVQIFGSCFNVTISQACGEPSAS